MACKASLLACVNKLYWIRAPHYTAGVLVNEKGIIVDTAPILRWAFGKQIVPTIAYWRKRGFDVRKI